MHRALLTALACDTGNLTAARHSLSGLPFVKVAVRPSFFGLGVRPCDGVLYCLEWQSWRKSFSLKSNTRIC